MKNDFLAGVNTVMLSIIALAMVFASIQVFPGSSDAISVGIAIPTVFFNAVINGKRTKEFHVKMFALLLGAIAFGTHIAFIACADILPLSGAQTSAFGTILSTLTLLVVWIINKIFTRRY